MENQFIQFLNSTVKRFINSYQNGASIDELSSRFGCSNTPIRRFLMNNGVKLRPPVRPLVLARNKDQVLAMYAEGANTREIADRFGVDRKHCESLSS